ncbi:MAG: methyltransferase [Thermoplasmata archaeon]|nr:methyltransferase [Thermoplasmata archaeon]
MPAEPGDLATEHYFSERPSSRSAPRTLRFLYRGEVLHFEVDRGVFASHGVDPGTALLIGCLEPRPTDRILDLGCGWGAIGAAAARAAPQGQVLLTDVNRRAVLLARSNLRRNRIANAEARIGSMFEPAAGNAFDLIATNPPYHIGRPAILALLEAVPAHLRPDGYLLMVGKGSQGIRFYQAWLEERWPDGVEVVDRGSGYRVLKARPRPRALQR